MSVQSDRDLHLPVAPVTEVIAFLASPSAGYITGATIAVDGGRSAV